MGGRPLQGDKLGGTKWVGQSGRNKLTTLFCLSVGISLIVSLLCVRPFGPYGMTDKVGGQDGLETLGPYRRAVTNWVGQSERETPTSVAGRLTGRQSGCETNCLKL